MTFAVSCLFLAVVVEGVTELLVNEMSIVQQRLWRRVQLQSRFPLLAEMAQCGYCTSFWVSLLICGVYGVHEWVGLAQLIVVWRLANYVHTVYSLVLRKKIFTGVSVEMEQAEHEVERRSS